MKQHIRKCFQVSNPFCKGHKKGRCHKVPKEVCKDVPVSVEKVQQIQRCHEVEVPRGGCHPIARKVCVNPCLTKSQPLTKRPCRKVHKTECFKVPDPFAKPCPKDSCRKIPMQECHTRMPGCKLHQCRRHPVRKCHRKKCPKKCEKKANRKCRKCAGQGCHVEERKSCKLHLKQGCHMCAEKCMESFLCPVCEPLKLGRSKPEVRPPFLSKINFHEEFRGAKNSLPTYSKKREEKLPKYLPNKKHKSLSGGGWK